MRATALFAMLGLLAACSERDDPAVSEQEDAGAASVGWTLEPGTYDYVRAEGGAGLIVLAADGTYSDVMSGGDLATGKWARVEGLNCLAAAGEDVSRCYRFTAPDANGRLIGTAADGGTLRLRKLE